MNDELFADAKRYIAGGVNSPVRAFKGVGGTPIFFARGSGPYLYDCDGRQYIDYVGSWGPMILGHAHPAVVAAVKSAADKGLSFGAPTTLETALAAVIQKLMPSMQKMRLVSSGTEAAMSAIRLARAFTGRDKIVKFEGCYHGHADSLLVKAGSGALTFGVPTSPGVPEALARLTLTLNYNDAGQARETFAAAGADIAAVIVEPVAGNMNCVPPIPGFLQVLRALCDEYGALLILDEVMTGFRVALGGAQSLYGVRPALTLLGKVIGGGLPVGAFGGRAEIMDRLAPDGPVYQAGTLSGNPVAMAAGLATLETVSEPGFFADIEAKTAGLMRALADCAHEAGIAFTANHVGGMWGIFFTNDAPVTRFAQVMACDAARFKLFFHHMLDQGIYLAPSAYEAGFMSSAHGPLQLEKTIAAARVAFGRLSR